VKVGDLVQVPKCGDIIDCECFFCYHKSSCIGVIVRRDIDDDVDHPVHRWVVMFDAGEWETDSWQIEVISESR